MIDIRNIFAGTSAPLRRKLTVHGASLLVVAILFGVVIAVVGAHRSTARESYAGIQKYLDMKNVDFGDPIDRQLFRESLDLFYPGQTGRNDSLLNAIDDLRQREFTDPAFKSGSTLQGLTFGKIASIAGMYVQFLVVYLVVLLILYFLSERIGIYKFVKMKQHRESFVAQFFEEAKQWTKSAKEGERVDFAWRAFKPLLEAIGKGFVLVILFSPAYVVAYALRTTVDTSSLIFMAILGVATNGVLIHTANRFYTLLVAESHKGYVQTAIAKGLHTSYEWDTPDGIPRRSLLTTRRMYREHVFHHIYMNARFQFIETLKEHASFLITGLIIIEMALNIQGHLCYELLQEILYRQYDVACFIVFCIFVAVKATEVAVDVWHEREKRRYGY